MADDRRSQVTTLELFVATDGNDLWSGRLPAPNAGQTDGPLASLTGARDAIRRIKHSDGLQQPIEVLVRGGVYRMAEPLRLSGGDSGTAECPITYRAYPGEEPLLSGGVPITDWRRHDDCIYCADLPDVRRGSWWFRQLFCNGKRMVRARYPKFDPDNPRYGGWAFIERIVQDGFDPDDYPVIELGPTWRFRPDPAAIGEEEQWHTGSCSDSDWAEVHSGDHWMNQGFKGYNGSAWYRLTFTMPEDFDTRRHLWLLFAGVDKEAWVYIDGELVFERSIASTGKSVAELFETPFKFDARPFLKPGRQHLVAVKVHSAELGGGLYQSVSLVSGEEDVETTVLSGRIREPMSFRYEKDLFPRRWARPRQAEVFVIPGRCWINDIIPVKSVDTERHTIHLTRPVGPSRHTLGHATHITAGNRFYVENNLEDLTEPGEWCLDSETGTLYVRPPAGTVENAEIVAPRLGSLIRMTGSRQAPVHHVTVRGFTLTQTLALFPTPESYYKTPNAGQAVYLENTEDCGIEENRFDAVGGDAIRLQNNNARNRIVGNEIAAAGAYGIFVASLQRGFAKHDTASGDVPTTASWSGCPEERAPTVAAWPRSGHHLISNNHIHDIGCFEKHANGIAFYGVSAPEVVVSHNLIHHIPRFGIGLMSGFGRVIIEYNHLHHLSLETCDTGGICSNRWYTYDEDPELREGCIIRFNRLLDVVGCGAYDTRAEPGGGDEAGGRIWRPYYSWGIYFDNGPMNVLVHDNICVGNTLGGICVLWYARNVTVENNIFADSSSSQAYVMADGEMYNVRIRRNIFTYRDSTADYMRLILGRGKDITDVIAEHDYNLYATPGGEPPTFSGLPGEAAMRIGSATECIQPNLEDWQAMGYDAHSIIGDPMFVDAADGNYDLHPDSPALKLGFQPIDTSRIGPTPT